MALSEDKTLILRSGTGQERSCFGARPSLLVVSGPEQGREIDVGVEPFSIGSSEDSDFKITDPAVSRRHCIISIDSGGYVITDTNSTNGTFVRGVRVMRAYLLHGDEIRIGSTRMIFNPPHGSAEIPLSESSSFGNLLGASLAMRRIFYLAETYAPTDASLMLCGETGTGKEILAEEIHRHSRRASKPFVVIDCSSIAHDVVESELFGHVKGAFTGAVADRAGSFAMADGGTVFLDEIGELPVDLQPKLLRIIEKREIKPVGGNSFRRVNVRVICATNKNLREEVAAGRFREDLFYRLSVVNIELPPLRNRKEDIPLLASFFAKTLHGDGALSQISDFDGSMAELQRYDWPGNVRELRNLIDRAFYSIRRPVDLTLCMRLGSGAYQGFVRHGLQDDGTESEAALKPDVSKPFKEEKNKLICDFEKKYIVALLKRNGGNVSKSAREADIERAYLQRLIRKYGIAAASHDGL